MKILVAVKRVVDPYVKIRLKKDNTGVDVAQVKMSMNPFDEIALEEAIRLQESKVADEVVVVSIGGDACQETLRQALALGANRAILVKPTNEIPDCSLNIAKILQAVVSKEAPNLVLMGKQSIDGDNNQTPQMLSALLGWSQATYASKILVRDNHAEVTREIDGGLEILMLPLPAVVSVDLRLNVPRYVTLPNIMKAKQKPLDTILLDTLGLTLRKHQEVVRVTPPAQRSGGMMVDSVAALIDKLKHEAKVL